VYEYIGYICFCVSILDVGVLGLKEVFDAKFYWLLT